MGPDSFLSSFFFIVKAMAIVKLPAAKITAFTNHVVDRRRQNNNLSSNDNILFVRWSFDFCPLIKFWIFSELYHLFSLQIESFQFNICLWAFILYCCHCCKIVSTCPLLVAPSGCLVFIITSHHDLRALRLSLNIIACDFILRGFQSHYRAHRDVFRWDAQPGQLFQSFKSVLGASCDAMLPLMTESDFNLCMGPFFSQSRTISSLSSDDLCANQSACVCISGLQFICWVNPFKSFKLFW